MSKGWFFTFEGGEGAGKTVQIRQLESWLIGMGYEVLVTREPGGVPIAEQIRHVLIGPEAEDMDAITEVLLYAAARREHYIKVIKPALKEGKIVLSDRFFDSSLVYQGMVKEGMDWKEILDINLKATNGVVPDLTLYFDIDPHVALDRIYKNAGREVNRFDKAPMHFHYLVRQGYITLATHFKERFRMVDAEQTPHEVFLSYLKYVRNAMSIPDTYPIKGIDY